MNKYIIEVRRVIDSITVKAKNVTEAKKIYSQFINTENYPIKKITRIKKKIPVKAIVIN